MQNPSLNLPVDPEIELRLIDERDAPRIFALIEQNRTYLREWLPWVDFTRTVEDEITFIRGLNAQYKDNKGFACAIWYQGQIAGTISYHPVNWTDRKVEIGYWQGAAFQGKGIMTKACKLMTAYAFDEFRLNKVEIRCATGNMRSCAIPQRLGFKREGVIRQGEWLYDHFVDLILYGLYADDWYQQQGRNE